MHSNPQKTSHKKSIYRFSILCLIVISYFSYLSYQYNFVTGGIASLLTWSFFVLCTPVADAGFLLDFPIRLLFGTRMLFSEVFVWCTAFFSSIGTLYYAPTYYETTALTKLFHTILTTPLPYWIIIILSTIGTFLSIAFGDHVIDVFSAQNKLVYIKKHKQKLIAFILVYSIVIVAYYKLLTSMHIEQLV